jgi:hypothetical protein
VWNGTWKRGFIDAVLKVKVYGMFYPVQKRSHSIKEYKSWFEGMNLIYKRPSFNRAISRKLVAKYTRKVLDYLYGQSYHQALHQHRSL